jgi:hypothetical protein
MNTHWGYMSLFSIHRGTLVRSKILTASIFFVFALDAQAAERPLQTELARISAHDSAAATPGAWSSWGGEVEFQFNPDRLRELGIDILSIDRSTHTVTGEPGVRYQRMRFAGRRSGALQFAVSNNKPDALSGGSLQYDGGFVLATPNGTVDLRNPRIQPSRSGLFALDVVDAAGTVWLTMDHAHFDLGSGNHSNFRLRDMNMRLSAAFAAKLGRPDLADIDIGGADIESEVTVRDARPEVACANTWPAAGLLTDIQVFYGVDTWTGHPDQVASKRCNIGESGACLSDSTTGHVVIAPDSSLRNAGATAVTWHSMFSGNFQPYANDQHPYLVWNMYRFDGDGGMKQIGVSGVKHAFETVNYNCSCSNYNIIYPGCEDTYSTFNNDTSDVLGPRSELIPAKAIWGRCGSVFDTNCDAHEDDGGITSSLHDHRLNVVESDLLPPLSTGASYYLEYWYVVREDQNIYNTMGHRSLSVAKVINPNSTITWNVTPSPAANFTLGPAINRWVDPAAPPAGAMNTEMLSSEGRARVAVKTTDLHDGRFRYEYAVMNFDFAWAVIDPAHPTEPNLKLLSNNGFENFSMAVTPNSAITDITFADTDLDSSNDWVGTVSGRRLTWSAPTGVNPLNWGTLYRFGYTSNVPPGVGKASLTLAAAEKSYDATTLSADDVIFIDSFDTGAGVSAGE